MIKMTKSPLYKEQQTLFSNGRGGTPPGVPFFNNSKKYNICDLCKKSFPCLTPVDFSKMIWIQGNSAQFIIKDSKLKKLEINLCNLCMKKVFAASVPAIPFSQKLFDVLLGVDSNG